MMSIQVFLEKKLENYFEHTSLSAILKVEACVGPVLFIDSTCTLVLPRSYNPRAKNAHRRAHAHTRSQVSSTHSNRKIFLFLSLLPDSVVRQPWLIELVSSLSSGPFNRCFVSESLPFPAVAPNCTVLTIPVDRRTSLNFKERNKLNLSQVWFHAKTRMRNRVCVL